MISASRRFRSQQGPAAQVPAVQLEQVEGVEVGLLAPEHERVEVAEAVRPEAYHLTVEHRTPGPNRVRDLLRELRPLGELVAAAGEEAGAAALDAGRVGGTVLSACQLRRRAGASAARTEHPARPRSTTAPARTAPAF